ncbi:TetR/AcrR family transcriptional regulator [Paraburkholderia dipogonis]|uniref:TetR/AcrR family transcriptional regulator n=1 Tax=Paraburkholderia dipogonis TaxID=1211383 RepID=UPI001FCC9268|nr:TetR/AcrR family transcriptional regulator [Paraburkholderia dipogonis]
MASDQMLKFSKICQIESVICMRASKRQLVVDKATVLFSKHGFQAVGVDWIIDDSGVARMTLYRHFSGKDDLIREVLLQRYALIIGSIEARLQRLTVPEERVKAIFDWYGDWFATPEFAGCLFERALAEFGTEYPKVSGVAIQYREKMTSWMAELLGMSCQRLMLNTLVTFS